MPVMNKHIKTLLVCDLGEIKQWKEERCPVSAKGLEAMQDYVRSVGGIYGYLTGRLIEEKGGEKKEFQALVTELNDIEVELEDRIMKALEREGPAEEWA